MLANSSLNGWLLLLVLLMQVQAICNEQGILIGDRCKCYQGKTGDFCENSFCDTKLYYAASSAATAFSQKLTELPLKNSGSKITPVYVEAGANHLIMLTNEGEVFTVGDNARGQLGVGTNITSSSTIVQVNNPESTTFIGVAAGPYHSLVITRNGNVWVFGFNDQCQLGLGKSDTELLQVAIPTLVEIKNSAGVSEQIIDVSASRSSSYALTVSGQVYGWGFKFCVPSVINTKDNLVLVMSAGHYHVVAMTPTGKLIAWGSRLYGSLGDGQGYIPGFQEELPIADQAVDVLFAPLDPVVQINCGVTRTTLLTSTGSVYHFGRLNPEGNFSPTPKLITFPILLNETIMDVSSRGSHLLVTTSAQSIFAMGESSYKQLALANSSLSFLPHPTIYNATFPSETILKLITSDYISAFLTGNTCKNQNISCFGMLNTEAHVCSGRGVCAGINKCVCAQGYEGRNCENYSCNGKRFTDISVCSYRGKCLRPNLCECKAGYGGPNCEYYQCYGKTENDPLVCGGRGICMGIDSCFCGKDYQGRMCQHTMCFGVNSSEPLVCSGFGTCTEYNVCTCMEGFSGPTCEEKACNSTLCPLLLKTTELKLILGLGVSALLLFTPVLCLAACLCMLAVQQGYFFFNKLFTYANDHQILNSLTTEEDKHKLIADAMIEIENGLQKNNVEVVCQQCRKISQLVLEQHFAIRSPYSTLNRLILAFDNKKIQSNRLSDIQDIVKAFHYLAIATWYDNQLTSKADYEEEESTQPSQTGNLKLNKILDAPWSRNPCTVFELACLREISTRITTSFSLFYSLKGQKHNTQISASIVHQFRHDWYAQVLTLKWLTNGAKSSNSIVAFQGFSSYKESLGRVDWQVRVEYINDLAVIATEAVNEETRRLAFREIVKEIGHFTWEMERSLEIRCAIYDALYIVVMLSPKYNTAVHRSMQMLLNMKVNDQEEAISQVLEDRCLDLEKSPNHQLWWQDNGWKFLQTTLSELKEESEAIDDKKMHVEAMRGRSTELEFQISQKRTRLSQLHEKKNQEELSPITAGHLTSLHSKHLSIQLAESKVQQLQQDLESELKGLDRAERELLAMRERCFKKKLTFDQLKNYYRTLMKQKAQELRSTLDKVDELVLTVRTSESAVDEDEPNSALIPNDFKCSITQQVFKDPVILVESEQTYEREAILQWLQDHDTDPKTNKVLCTKQLITNHSLRNSIEEFYQTITRL